MAKKDILSVKELLFCHEYIANLGNGKQAAIAAGYASNSAKVTASKLLTKPNLVAKIEELRDKLTAKSTKTAEDIRKELEYLAFSRITDVVSVNESGATILKDSENWPDGVSAAVESISVKEDNTGVHQKIKLWNKPQSLKMLGQERGMFKEQVEHTVGADLAEKLTAALNKAQGK